MNILFIILKLLKFIIPCSLSAVAVAYATTGRQHSIIPCLPLRLLMLRQAGIIPSFHIFNIPSEFTNLATLKKTNIKVNKKYLLLIILIAFSVNLNAQEQKKSSIPSVNIKKTDGSAFNTENISNDGKPIIISFWATWCKPCIQELNAISEIYSEWQEETGVKLIALSVDDARTMNSVAPFVNAKRWEYDVYLDPNGDFKRAMNVNLVPHVFLLNGNREIVHQHTSYAPGDEEHLFEKVKKAAAGKSMSE